MDSLRPQPVRRVRRLLHDVSLHHHGRLPDQRPPHAPPQGGLPAHDQCVGVHGRQHAHHNMVLLSSIVLALTTNPTLGLLGAGLLLVLLFAFMFFIAPLCYCGTMLLHEEVVHVLKKREEKRHWPAPAPTPAPALAPSRPPALTPPPPSRPSSLSGGNGFFRPAIGQASGRISHSGSPLVPWHAPQGSADASPKFAHPPSSGVGPAPPCWTTQPPTPFQARQSRISRVSTGSDTEHQDAENDLHEVVVM